MTCDQAREGLSALLDGEDPGVAPDLLDQHLQGCADCRAWREAAVHVTRRARLQQTRVPDLSGEVLDRLTKPEAAAPQGGQRLGWSVATLARRSAGRHTRSRPESWRTRPHRVTALRALLIATALGQAATGVRLLVGASGGLLGGPGTLVGGSAAADETVHTAHELGAFTLALAVTIAWASWRPATARTCLPILGTATGVLVAATVPDLWTGTVLLTAETAHLGLVIGTVLVGALAWATRLPPPDGQPDASDGPSDQRGPRSGPPADPGRLSSVA